MLPEQFIKRLHQQFNDAEEFIAALQKDPVTSVRKHRIKEADLELDIAKPVDWCPDGYYLKTRPIFTLDPLFHAGAYYVQESSSMFLWQILDALFEDKNIRMLDLCAAPGGKSTLISSWLNSEGLLISNELIKTRAQVLLENITKWGYANNWVTSTDAYVLGGLNEFFDCILIDAPCSGEGLFRRDKTAIEEWSVNNCELCAGRQRKIVVEILPALSVGGYLIYSTCTFNPAENDDNIKWMLSQFPLEVVDMDFEIDEIKKTEAGGFAFYPHLTRGEGFYCCVLRKTAEVDLNAGIKRQKISLEKVDPKKLQLNHFLKDDEGFDCYSTAGSVIAIAKEYTREFETISSLTKILGGYIRIGEFKGKDLIPDHSLAMSIHLHDPFPRIELTMDQSLQYLSRGELKIESDQVGWCLVSYKNTPLGFVKMLPNRVNNYYPVEWRIRMEV